MWTGKWKYLDSGIGPNQDSFYEYLLKAYILFGDPEYLVMFEDFYRSINQFMKKQDWYVDVAMQTGQVSLPWFTSLAGFWPGLQVLYGDIGAATRSLQTFQQIWRQFGFAPEAFDLNAGAIARQLHGYFLRPEMAESTMYLARATEDPYWTEIGRDYMVSIQQATWTPCGYAVVENVTTHKLGDRMESFFLSETLKYLYLLFDADNFIHGGNYVFSTEGHPFKVSKLTRRFDFEGAGPLDPAPGSAPGAGGQPQDASASEASAAKAAPPAEPTGARDMLANRRSTCRRKSLRTRLSANGIIEARAEHVPGPKIAPGLDAIPRKSTSKPAAAAAAAAAVAGGAAQPMDVASLFKNLMGGKVDGLPAGLDLGALLKNGLKLVVDDDGTGKNKAAAALLGDVAGGKGGKGGSAEPTDGKPQAEVQAQLPAAAQQMLAQAAKQAAQAAKPKPLSRNVVRTVRRVALREVCHTLHNTNAKAGDTFWSYEVCFGRFVRQYHADEKGKETLSTSVGVRNTAARVRSAAFASVQDIVLGTYSDTRPAAGTDGAQHVVPQAFPPKSIYQVK